jgi:putative proteasome-type protease
MAVPFWIAASSSTRPRCPKPPKYALISMDSTMRSNVTVGPPLDLMVYQRDSFSSKQQRRLAASDPDLRQIHQQWETSLRRGVQELPQITFEDG